MQLRNEMDKSTNKDQQNSTQEIKDWATQIHKSVSVCVCVWERGGKLKFSGRELPSDTSVAKYKEGL
jgi:hypothetical protein